MEADAYRSGREENFQGRLKLGTYAKLCIASVLISIPPFPKREKDRAQESSLKRIYKKLEVGRVFKKC